MIIYGFYGTGKSTVVNRLSDAEDLDYNIFRSLYSGNLYDNFEKINTAYAQRAKSLSEEGKTVFINCIAFPILNVIQPDIFFIQEDYKECVSRLLKRKQGEFIPYEEEYKGILSQLKKLSDIKLILLKKDEYISDHIDLIRDNGKDR